MICDNYLIEADGPGECLHKTPKQVFEGWTPMVFARDLSAVMAGLVPAIHVFAVREKKDVDARDKRGHDGNSSDVPMTIDVLSIGAFPEATNTELASRFAVTRHFNRPAPELLSAELRGRIRGIATEANRGADRALIMALPKLEIICVFGVGTDNIDLAAARERNIPVTNTPGILTDEVADLAIGLMLSSARQIIFADRYVRDGSWRSKGPIPLGRSVGGKTLGVGGLGGIGRAIANKPPPSPCV